MQINWRHMQCYPARQPCLTPSSGPCCSSTAAWPYCWPPAGSGRRRTPPAQGRCRWPAAGSTCCCHRMQSRPCSGLRRMAMPSPCPGPTRSPAACGTWSCMALAPGDPTSGRSGMHAVSHYGSMHNPLTPAASVVPSMAHSKPLGACLKNSMGAHTCPALLPWL